MLLTFAERMTREEIIIKIKGKSNEYVIKIINSLERKYGKRFYTKFKTITFDNGLEFIDYEDMEKSCLRKIKRTEIYYAHPYKEFIKQIEDWLNNYPRVMFDYQSSNMLYIKYITTYILGNEMCEHLIFPFIMLYLTIKRLDFYYSGGYNCIV